MNPKEYLRFKSMFPVVGLDDINKNLRDYGAIETTGREVIPLKELTP